MNIEKLSIETAQLVHKALKEFGVDKAYISTLPVKRTYVVRSGEVIMGVTVHPEVKEGEPCGTGWTVVNPAYQNQGIYSALMEFKINLIKEAGASKITTVVPYSYVSEYLQKNHGFVVTGDCDLSSRWGNDLDKSVTLELTF